MSGIAARIETLVDERIRPLIADRGGDVAFRDFSGGIVTLTIVGSPGAALPIKENIASLLRHYMPEVAGVEVVGPSAGAEPDRRSESGASPADEVRRVLDAQINPAVRAHGGAIALSKVEDAVAYVRFEGGCQGCAMAHVTLRQGVEVMIRNEVPEIVAVVDVTDHASGTEPYFKTKKGAD